MSGEKRTERLSNRNLWAFSAGHVGQAMAYTMWTSFLLACIMYTKSVTPAQLSIILVTMTACRIFDAINDPIMGGIIEKTRTKWGKFKPWIVLGSITNSIVFYAVFAVPLTGKAFVIFFPFAYVLWDITFTMNDIGYWAMMPSLTSDEDGRNKITTISNLLGGIGGEIANFIIPIITVGALSLGGSAVTGYKIVALVIGIGFAGFQAITAVFVKEKPLPTSTTQEKTGIKEMFRVIFKNDQLMWIALVMIFYNLCFSLYSSSYANFIYFRFGYVGKYASIFGTVSGLLSALSIVYPLLARRFTRKQISFISVLMSAFGFLLFFIIGATTAGKNSSMLLYVFLLIAASLVVCGQTMFNTVLVISIANTIEYNEWKMGNRDEGIIFSIRPFMAKLGSALVALVQAGVFALWKGSNGKAVSNYTKEISDLENAASQVIANEGQVITTITTNAEEGSLQYLFNHLANGANLTYQQVQDKIVAEGNTASFEAVISGLKDAAIENVLANVEVGAIIWLLFCLTILPLLFLIVGYVIWLKKFKIDEVKYSAMLEEIQARKEHESESESNTNCDASDIAGESII